MNKPSRLKLKIAAGLGAAALATGSYFLLLPKSGKPFLVPSYRVERVVDGDTFITTKKQHIRLASVEAPEPGRCASTEATRALERLIIDKPVYLKVLWHDPFQRLVSLVYTDAAFINQEMLEKGYAYFARGNSESGSELSKFTDRARDQKLGIFSKKCTQTENALQPKCNIKGNNRNGQIYYLPSCGVYPNVTVQLHLGDRWFCSEKEALAAGFRKVTQCP